MEFILRSFRPEDAASISKHGNNPAIAGNMTDAFPHPYTEEKALAFITRALQADPPRLFAIEVNGEAAGGIGIHPQEDVHRKNAELGYWLAQPYWGKGIASRAVAQMRDYAFRTLDITRLYARPYGPNVASQRVLEKAGFTLEARLEKTIFKNGEFLDELIYAVRR